jgi:hypothetical protein
MGEEETENLKQQKKLRLVENLPRATKMLRAVIAWISQETARLSIRF